MEPGRVTSPLAASPDAWLLEHRPVPSPAGASVAVGLAQLLADDAAFLRRRFDRARREGWPPQAAALTVLAVFAGELARLVGVATAGSGAHWLVDVDDVTWHLDPEEEWVVSVSLREPAVAVPADHPWAGLPSARVEDDVD